MSQQTVSFAQHLLKTYFSPGTLRFEHLTITISKL